MKKEITIVADMDCPIIHLLNQEDWIIYEAKGEDAVFTMVKKDKTNEL